jgi:hypothetical protein
MPLFLLQQILLQVLHMLMMRFSSYLWTQKPSVFPQPTASQCILWRNSCINLYFFLWFLLQIFDIPPLATCSFRSWFQFQTQQLDAWQFHNPKTTGTTLTTTRQMVAYCKRWLRSEKWPGQEKLSPNLWIAWNFCIFSEWQRSEITKTGFQSCTWMQK